MHGYALSGILGVVEGITEFLPVSSTAHLRLAEKILGLSLESGYWKMYSIVIQLGAILCLPVYFWPRIMTFLKSFLTTKDKLRHPFTLVMMAFVITAIPSLLLIKVIGANLENPAVMAWSLVIGGIVMGAVDLMKAKAEHAGENAPQSSIKTWHMEDMTVFQAAFIGACQIFSAVFPGTSRSMSTIAAGQLAGLSRAAALEFSFFLSMPTMAAAVGYTLLKSLLGHGKNAVGISHLTHAQWMMMGEGFVVSFIVAYISVALLMRWVRQGGFMPFAVYRVLAGIAVFKFML
ncbi:MAG: undecaprenyl-diphosphate phosphatase [Alphaproteobacteria bacterium]|nr:undecaprenyl-diphosphate phosphatase [Alphaproteobacteria bacterium]MDE2336826.1 undecaprenyl-diphosphate phosphatase [Alphaproteobacteria bacterium]